MHSSPRPSITLSQTLHSEPDLTLRLFPLLRSRFLLTLLEASVIHPSVFIAYYGLHRIDNNGPFRIRSSILVLSSTLPPPSYSSVRVPSRLNSLTTKPNTHPRVKYSPTLTPFLHHHPPYRLQSTVYLYIRPRVPCISDYAPYHSHLIFITVPSLLFPRVLG